MRSSFCCRDLSVPMWLGCYILSCLPGWQGMCRSVKHRWWSPGVSSGWDPKYGAEVLVNVSSRSSWAAVEVEGISSLAAVLSFLSDLPDVGFFEEGIFSLYEKEGEEKVLLAEDMFNVVSLMYILLNWFCKHFL